MGEVATVLKRPHATPEDLYRVPENGKAEIVEGKLVIAEPTGALPGRAGLNIVISLRQMESKLRGGPIQTMSAFL